MVHMNGHGSLSLCKTNSTEFHIASKARKYNIIIYLLLFSIRLPRRFRHIGRQLWEHLRRHRERVRPLEVHQVVSTGGGAGDENRRRLFPRRLDHLRDKILHQMATGHVSC